MQVATPQNYTAPLLSKPIVLNTSSFARQAGTLLASRFHSIEEQSSTLTSNVTEGFENLTSSVAEGFENVHQNAALNNDAIQGLASNWNAFSMAIDSVPLTMSLDNEIFTHDRFVPDTFKTCSPHEIIKETAPDGEQFSSCSNLSSEESNKLYNMCVFGNEAGKGARAGKQGRVESWFLGDEGHGIACVAIEERMSSLPSTQDALQSWRGRIEKEAARLENLPEGVSGKAESVEYRFGGEGSCETVCEKTGETCNAFEQAMLGYDNKQKVEEIFEVGHEKYGWLGSYEKDNVTCNRSNLGAEYGGVYMHSSAVEGGGCMLTEPSLCEQVPRDRNHQRLCACSKIDGM